MVLKALIAPVLAGLAVGCGSDGDWCVPGYSQRGPTAVKQREDISRIMTQGWRQDGEYFCYGTQLWENVCVIADTGGWHGDEIKEDWYLMSGFVKAVHKCDNPELVAQKKLPATRPQRILLNYVLNKMPDPPNQAEVDAMNRYPFKIAGEIQHTRLALLD